MISIVMATYNGENTLRLTLDAFSEIDAPDGGTEFIVVNNGSTDRTEQILFEYQARLSLQILNEPKPGRARALNRGIAHASGDLIIVTDDDVLPDTGWLKAYAKAAEQFDDVDVFAGQVRHFWQKSPPKWMEQLAAEGLSYGGTMIDRVAGPIEAHLIKGANFAARRHTFDEFKLNEELGFGANNDMIGGDETEFARRAVDAGYKIWFIPTARIRHIVRPHEVAVWPVFRRYFRIGRGLAVTNSPIFDRRISTLFGYPRYLFRTLPTDAAKVLILVARGNSFEAMKLIIDIAATTGKAYQWSRMRRAQHTLECGR